MREILAETIADLGKATQLRRDQLSKEIFRLEAHEENRQDLVQMAVCLQPSSRSA
jgi:hypothetical protein